MCLWRGLVSALLWYLVIRDKVPLWMDACPSSTMQRDAECSVDAADKATLCRLDVAGVVALSVNPMLTKVFGCGLNKCMGVIGALHDNIYQY